jgi:hypothetical protein
VPLTVSDPPLPIGKLREKKHTQKHKKEDSDTETGDEMTNWGPKGVQTRDQLGMSVTKTLVNENF